ncbi:tetratricopeptide repeat protein [Myroides marinus]|uniref:type IX secretion system periplasmic lipoprotein PorW/SprE n=1 Tax=Myroides marinus TaxID=703342 RepID=UPI002576E2CA|nr:tetratricopeptide repeat protein [Myroides marinus]MDM1368854.1 tetratricopeptide repeat protein [Myroides marinus]MDM1371147.1 tetratricopeptide repeat protein [Myroides marinus]MDM1374073.1 tetratricopeptide repeat protein [Myroides marinus]MDM1382661.1 tetratricopeptide repeat protein [Myroides marinus]MDM1388546.1 tetratricopeptide repeat protein [Myroides marinus]
MLKNRIKYVIFLAVLLLGAACSVKQDRLLNRGYHAMTTRYNILYNGELAYDDALISLKKDYFDDFWEILPVERIDIKIDSTREFDRGRSLESKKGSILENIQVDGDQLGGAQEQGEQGFRRAEDKAAKAIQKHSMYIKGRERNFQIDDAYLMLGQARYYDGRFVPALEAFNYILYKYPDGSLANEASIWREKTNVRLTYDDIAIKNLNLLLRDKKKELSKQEMADANATLTQAYINIEEYQQAIAPLKIAIENTKDKEERARYTFILGQLYGKLGRKGEAATAFTTVIEMNRKSPRSYVIQSHAQQYGLNSESIKDSVAFLKKYKKLIKDRENRAYLDVLHRQVGLFYEHNGNTKEALNSLKKAVKLSKGDKQLKAQNYLSIAEIYFNEAGYALAGQYYDSVLAIMPPKAKERFRITKRRDALRDVVAFEKVAHVNDSILRLVAMSDDQRISYFQKYVDDLRKEDFRKLQANLKGKKAGNQNYFNMANFGDAIASAFDVNAPTGQGNRTFYFYSAQATSNGKMDFRRRWGNRPLVDNWRWASDIQDAQSNASNQEATTSANSNTNSGTAEQFNDARYDINAYIVKIPTDEMEIASLKKDRDFAYFQLGSMYADRFKKYDLASSRLEALLTFDPTERLVLPSMYKLYKIYLEIDMAKAVAMKDRIISQYPNSRYAKLLQNMSVDKIDDLSPEQIYAQAYKVYAQGGDYNNALRAIDSALERFDDDGYVSKLELLKAHVIGKLKGVTAYKEALNFVALTYSSSKEGKEAENLLKTIIPSLESRNFTNGDSKNWKVVIFVNDKQSSDSQMLSRSFIQFSTNNSSRGIKYSEDMYLDSKEFLVLHGFKTKEEAEKAAHSMNNNAVVISAENYIIVQIKKNWEEYLTPKEG